MKPNQFRTNHSLSHAFLCRPRIRTNPSLGNNPTTVTAATDLDSTLLVDVLFLSFLLSQTRGVAVARFGQYSWVCGQIGRKKIPKDPFRFPIQSARVWPAQSGTSRGSGNNGTAQGFY